MGLSRGEGRLGLLGGSFCIYLGGDMDVVVGYSKRFDI